MATLKQICEENLALIKECTKPYCTSVKHRYGYCEFHAIQWKKYLDLKKEAWYADSWISVHELEEDDYNYDPNW